jgi:ribosome-associated toxin RatA of RatAB toxin-antitoxin module
MKRLWSLVALSFAFLAFTLSSPAAHAADDEAAKLATHGKALRYTLKTTSPPSSIDMGGAGILINAPIAAVRKIVTSYGAYQKFLSPFDQSRVLSKRKGVSEVYLQVPILNGAMHIWTVADMSPPVKDGAGEIITARFKRGNVADFRANWRLRVVDAERTILKLELLVDPKMPFPSSLVTTQLVNSAEKAVTAVRDRAQAASTPGTKSNAVSASDSAAAPASAAPRAQDAAPTSVPSQAAKADEQSKGRQESARGAISELPADDDEVARRQEDVARR